MKDNYQLDEQLRRLEQPKLPQLSLPSELSLPARLSGSALILTRNHRLILSVLVVVIVFCATSPGVVRELSLSRLGSWLLGLSAILLLTISYAGPGLAQRPDRRLRRLLAPVLLLLLMVALASESAYLSWADFLVAKENHGCLVHSLATGLLSALALGVIWRRTEAFSPVIFAASLAALGGLVGALSVGLTCKSSEAFHLFITHGLTAALLTFGLTWALHRQLSP